jgi:hypothetical protein
VTHFHQLADLWEYWSGPGLPVMLQNGAGVQASCRAAWKIEESFSELQSCAASVWKQETTLQPQIYGKLLGIVRDGIDLESHHEVKDLTRPTRGREALNHNRKSNQ